ncbi:MAG: CBS domain-containing protein [Acidimicrobiales bacterium]
MTLTALGKLGEFDHREPVVISPFESLRHACEVMWTESIGVIVVGTASHPVGILSANDVVAKIARGADPDVITVEQAMTKSVITARLEDLVHDAAYVMLDEAIRHLPISDDEGTVIGMVSVGDLLRPLLVESLERP